MVGKSPVHILLTGKLYRRERPLGGVVLDSSGNLYGTTSMGGSGTAPPYQCGTVFELNPGEGGQWVETVLYNFQGGSIDGYDPQAGVILDKAGNLYGTTLFGFAYQNAGINNGVVFALTRKSGGQWQENVLYAFCGPAHFCGDGSGPYGGLVFDKDGNLYGTTSLGGSFDKGVVFALTPGAARDQWNEGHTLQL